MSIIVNRRKTELPMALLSGRNEREICKQFERTTLFLASNLMSQCSSELTTKLASQLTATAMLVASPRAPTPNISPTMNHGMLPGPVCKFDGDIIHQNQKQLPLEHTANIMMNM